MSTIHFRGRDLEVPLAEGTTGTYARVLKTWLKDIMYGNEQHHWGTIMEEEEEDGQEIDGEEHLFGGSCA